ncbi:hypothetical protein BGX38DRAFT_798852 [Terfezia claveryi]|nr:hypothetical protein BGX38DRAFT_798852 [Terfezia claveryi]
MSNYPPTPAFRGGFVMSQPPFPGKPNGPIKAQPQQPASAPHFTTQFPPLAEKTPSVSNVGFQHANGNHLSVVGGREGDREEGEVSDVEMENAKLPSDKVNVQAVGQLKARANGNTANSNGKFLDKSYETLSGSMDPRKAKSLTAQISALNLREQSWFVNQTNHTSHTKTHSPVSHQNAQSHPSSLGTLLTDLASRENTAVANHTLQQMEEMRKKAQAAVLNLLPLKMTFKDIVDAGIHPFVLRQVFERIGLPIPSEEIAQSEDVSTKAVQENRDKELEKEREREKEKDKENTERERDREKEEKVQRDREAKHLILQEKLRKQELILREQEEQRVKELARKLKEKQDRKEQEERERKVREEAVAAAKKKKEREERLQAEAARKKEEDLEQLKVKQRILQQKFEEMKLPAKPPLPATPTPQVFSLPPRLTLAPSLPPPPFAPSTIASRATIMIPGLLLDNMDMGPRAPETPMTAPVSVSIPPVTHETFQNEDTIMREAPDILSFPRKKRPVAADFDTEPSMKLHQHKRRFGSLNEETFIFELTEDEDEDTEVDEPINNSSLKRQNSIRLPSQASKSPPVINGAAKPERNGKSPLERTPPAANGTTDAAKQLQDTEEKIRRLREEIQARQEKKRKPSATATPTGTGTPARVATPLEIHRLGSNSSPSLPLPSPQLPLPSPLKLCQSEKTTRVEIPGFGEPSLNDTSTSSSSIATSVLEVNPSTEPKQLEEITLVTEQSEAIQPSAHVLKPIPSDNQQKAEEGESQKMRDEVERLRMLLLSKRKAMELKPPGTAKTEELSEAPINAEIIGLTKEAPPVPIEIIDVNSVVNNDNMNPGTTIERVLGGIAEGIETDAARVKSAPRCMALGVTEQASEAVLISEATEGQPKLPPCQSLQTLSQQLGKAVKCQSLQTISQQLGKAVTERPESPPYEPFLENTRNDYDSPPMSRPSVLKREWMATYGIKWI